jgi:hypothetical protein
MHADERHTYGMAPAGSTPMKRAYEMAYGRGIPMRYTHHERYAYEMASVRGMYELL